ncbi:Putative secreted protein [Corynebacterium glyciniphilum AJ 3170]|uniref:Putative secreted protein n=1 Tax=Corynebacterium glyciniphilum AJ 3170 TaxID=1404245 RepID=X5DHM4_9CORY|nr:hypothetical protein [Corynebacterium glyciniphilum]AHW62543.1 Putative secreted protein [Corynebacterium glyciniphilum AJ 3170]
MKKTHLPRRVYRYAASLATAGLITAPLVLASTGSALADQETPAERCQRQTAEYNAAMETAWRAAHPGKEPTGNEWPPYICRDIPTPTLPPGPPPGGGNGGSQPAPERTHQYEGFDRPDSEYQQDMALGAPRTGLAERMGTAEPTDTTGASAGNTARSNVRDVVPWDTTVTDDNGNPRDVRVVDTPDGPAVITDNGTATGEILTTDTDSGVTSVTRQDGLEGRQLTDRNSSNDRGDRDDTDDTSSAAPTSAAPAPGVDDTADEAVAGDGDNETGGLPVGPLGAGGALAGAAGAILADRRRRDGAHRGDINWGNGREQSLILLEGVYSPREHRFDMDVPEGGQMVKNPDGSVDVLDADGNVVEHVKAPWAYDASGRPVETYYEVDNETGELVQIVDPDRTTLLPILADPDKEKKDGVGIVDTTGRSDGDTWTEDLGNGETATHTIPEGTGGQTVDTRIEREDGTFTDTRSVQNDVGGWDAWSNNDDGTSAYAQSNQDDGTHYSEHYDTAPTPQAAVQPDVTSQGNADNSQGTVLADNPDGTQSYGDYQRTGDNQYEMQVDNPNGTTSDIQSTQRDDAGVSTQVDDPDGSRVSTDGETVVPLDDSGNDVTGNQEPDPNTGRFYDPDTGEWINGAVIGGVPVYRGDDGKLTDTEGNEVSVERNEYGQFEASDAAAAAYDVGTDLPIDGRIAEIEADRDAGRIRPDDADAQIRALKGAGRALGAAGTGLGIAADIQDGESPAKATTTNILGGLGGAAAVTGTGLLLASAGVTAPVWVTAAAGVTATAAATYAATEATKWVWDRIF